jgi:hypothetical protein
VLGGNEGEDGDAEGVEVGVAVGGWRWNHWLELGRKRSAVAISSTPVWK